MEKEVERERTDGLDGSTLPHLPLRSLCRRTFHFAAAARLPPQCSPNGQWLVSFFFFAFILMV